MVDSAPDAQLWWVSLGHAAVSESKETCTDYCRLVQRTTELTYEDFQWLHLGQLSKKKKEKKSYPDEVLKLSKTAKTHQRLPLGDGGRKHLGRGPGHGLHLGNTDGDMQWSKSIELDIQDLYIYFKKKKCK